MHLFRISYLCAKTEVMDDLVDILRVSPDEAKRFYECQAIVCTNAESLTLRGRNLPYLTWVGTFSPDAFTPDSIEMLEQILLSFRLGYADEHVISCLAGGLSKLADRVADQGSTTDLANLLLDKANTLIDRHKLSPIDPHMTWTFSE